MAAIPRIHDDLNQALAEAKVSLDLPGLNDEADHARFLQCLGESTTALGMLRRGDVQIAKGTPVPHVVWPINEAYRRRRHNPEEATWLAFLATHIGWERPASCVQVYCALGSTPVWHWRRVQSNPDELKSWLTSHHRRLSAVAPFGNHRKFETHRPGRGTPDTICSYLELVGKSQEEFLRRSATDSDPFDALYSAFMPVVRFGRTACYDLVRLLHNLGILEAFDLGFVRPKRCYLEGATGPLEGAIWLFHGDVEGKVRSLGIRQLEERCRRLAEVLRCDLQVIEDALCNWQKGSHRSRRPLVLARTGPQGIFG